jgi:hypothetical protein
MAFWVCEPDGSLGGKNPPKPPRPRHLAFTGEMPSGCGGAAHPFAESPLVGGKMASAVPYLRGCCGWGLEIWLISAFGDLAARFWTLRRAPEALRRGFLALRRGREGQIFRKKALRRARRKLRNAPQGLPGAPQALPATPEAFADAPKGLAAAPEAFHARPRTLHARHRTFHARPRTLHARPRTLHARPRTFHAPLIPEFAGPKRNRPRRYGTAEAIPPPQSGDSAKGCAAPPHPDGISPVKARCRGWGLGGCPASPKVSRQAHKLAWFVPSDAQTRTAGHEPSMNP